MSAAERLARRGRLARELGDRLALARAVGPRHAWRWRRANAELARTARTRRAAVYREIWGEAAALVGARIDELTPHLWAIERDGRRTRVRHQTTALDDVLAIELSLEKLVVHRLLTEAGLPVPRHREFTLKRLDDASAFLFAAGGPCVVKPVATEAGWGVTAGIQTEEELVRAAVRAARFGPQVLIEQQVPGSVYRLLVLDGEVIDAVHRHPPRLVGDGRSSINRLVERENSRRTAAGGRAGLSPLRLDLDALLTLRRVGLAPRSVPQAGQTFGVKTVSQQNRNEDNETVRSPIASGLLAEAATAATAIGLRLAGVDVIAPDLARPLVETGGVVLEVNGEPGLHHHYQVADPEGATRVAVPILERTLA
jgi:D-alanine-D-alanine ligase-like ATP-grasp enzyme